MNTVDFWSNPAPTSEGLMQMRNDGFNGRSYTQTNLNSELSSNGVSYSRNKNTKKIFFSIIAIISS